MAKKRMKTILLALMITVLCVVLIAAGTYALFSDSVTVKNHLQAGTLKVTLVRTAHSYKVLDSDGFLKTTAVADEAMKAEDITNAFELPTDALIAPQSELSATFEIQNNDTVAFNYSVQLVLLDENGNEIDPSSYDENNLAKQLKIELTSLTGDHTLGESKAALTVSGAEAVKVHEKAEFTVKVTFIDNDAINNLVQGQQVYFDLIVSATQAVSA